MGLTLASRNLGSVSFLQVQEDGHLLSNFSCRRIHLSGQKITVEPSLSHLYINNDDDTWTQHDGQTREFASTVSVDIPDDGHAGDSFCSPSTSVTALFVDVSLTMEASTHGQV